MSVSKNKNLIYDVGMAWPGGNTGFYLQKGFCVVAFEALPQFIGFAKKMFPNEVEAGKLILVEGAITNKTNGAPMTFYESDNPSSSTAHQWLTEVHKSAHGTDVKSIQVPPVNFVEMLGKHGVPHYMKIDIEGSDELCIDALKNFEERPSTLSIELPTGGQAGCEQIVDKLSRLGYNNFQVIPQHKGMGKYKEPNPAREGNYAGGKWAEPLLFGKDLPEKDWKSAQKVLDELERTNKKIRWMQGSKAMNKLMPLLGMQHPWNDLHAKHELTD